MEKLQPVGDDAFTQGFLNKQFANLVISRVNRQMEVNGIQGVKFIMSEENIVLDMSGLFQAPNTNNFDAWLGGILVTYAIPSKLV